MDPINASDTWRWFGYENSWVNLMVLKLNQYLEEDIMVGEYLLALKIMEDLDLLFLNNGIWDGKRVISQEWIQKSITPSETNPEYGYMWWINSELGDGLSNYRLENVPTNIFYGSGFGGNKVIIIQMKIWWLLEDGLGEIQKVLL